MCIRLLAVSYRIVLVLGFALLLGYLMLELFALLFPFLAGILLQVGNGIFLIDNLLADDCFYDILHRYHTEEESMSNLSSARFSRTVCLRTTPVMKSVLSR